MFEQDAEGRLTHMFVWSVQSRDLAHRFPSVFLADCTYKTLVYGMPVFQIVGATSLNTTFTAAVVFLRHETRGDFVWALGCFRAMPGVRHPAVFIADRDLALMGALSGVLPDTRHMLCIWHIFKNVEARYKRVVRDHDAEEIGGAAAFTVDFKGLAFASTRADFDAMLERMQAHPSPLYGECVVYLCEQWVPYKEKWATAWTKNARHLRNEASSRAEGAHNALKTELRMLLSPCHRILPLFVAVSKYCSLS